jgi:hypothetical protein
LRLRHRPMIEDVFERHVVGADPSKIEKDLAQRRRC